MEGFTASERRVVQMAADGLTNPRIAQALFVTLKTVERHLINAYRKLHVRSRSELPGCCPARHSNSRGEVCGQWTAGWVDPDSVLKSGKSRKVFTDRPRR